MYYPKVHVCVLEIKRNKIMHVLIRRIVPSDSKMLDLVHLDLFSCLNICLIALESEP